MPRYNLAYRPKNDTFAAACIATAQKHFAALQDGYVLAEGAALPHVTLSQFEAPEALIADLWKDLFKQAPSDIDLGVEGFSIRPGRDHHRGYVWVALNIGRDSDLVSAQSGIYQSLQAQKLRACQRPGDQYYPHLTLARLPEANADKIGSFWPSALFTRQPFSLSLGLSDVNGVYQRAVY